MLKMNLPSDCEENAQSGFVIKRLIPLNDLYSYMSKCNPETLSQALNLYIAALEGLCLPDAVAASYLQVEALLAKARIMQDCGCGDEPGEPIQCPRFSAVSDGFLRCCEWTYELLRDALECRGQYNGRAGNLGIARARFYIDRHFTDPDLMLKDAAAEAGMSCSRFSTVFAREIGSTFTEYVTNLRVEKARSLLAGTTLRIAQIAAAVGYNDPHYFSWIFRKISGCTPTEYRDADRQSDEG